MEEVHNQTVWPKSRKKVKRDQPAQQYHHLQAVLGYLYINTLEHNSPDRQHHLHQISLYFENKNHLNTSINCLSSNLCGYFSGQKAAFSFVFLMITFTVSPFVVKRLSENYFSLLK